MKAASTPPATIHIVQNGHEQVLLLSGAWTLPNYLHLEADSRKFQPKISTVQRIDVSGIQTLDTAGAQILHTLLGHERALQLAQDTAVLTAPQRALLLAVVQAQQSADQTLHAPAAASGNVVTDMLERVGQDMQHIGRNILALLGFAGLVLATAMRTVLHPRRWRITAFVANVEQTTLNAVPIVVLMNFLIGAVVAFLGASMLRMFGATIFTIHLVGLSFMREFGPLMSAILVAGRTASAFAAQIGSMRANEEIDAIRVLGLNPVEILVLPRVLALVVGLPLLTFLAILAGLYGGMLVCSTSLNISMLQFVSVLTDSISVRHFFIGMTKAPIFAFLIAVIGCLEGFKVQGSAQSVGEHTTSAVVQSIFLMILVDAVVALFCMEMDW